MSALFAGQPLTKQVSQSLVQPQTLTSYAEFFRQNSSREDGWISVKFSKSEDWQHKFFVFEEGVLSYADSEYSELTNIPMDQVISFKTDTSRGDPTIQIQTTAQGKLILKLTNTAEMNKWLFCFQKSVALVLTHLMRSTERLSPPGSIRERAVAPSPEKTRKSEHNNSTGWMGPQSYHPNSDAIDIAFRRSDTTYGQDSRRAGRRSSSTDMPSGITDFRQLDSLREPVRRGSHAIPIQQAHANGKSHNGQGHGYGHASSHHSHAMMEPRSRALSTQSHGLRSVSQDGSSGRGLSVDKVATSYKEDDEEILRLEDLLQSPSEGSPRQSESQNSEDSNDGDMNGDWRSKASSDVRDGDDDDDLMFDLDETVETRNSMAEQKPNNLNNSNYSTTSQPRSHSSESTGHGADSFYSFGKALSLSLALDGKSPSRRSSHTSHASSAQSQHGGANSSGGSPTAASRAAHHAHQASACVDRINRTDFLMWESGFCSKLGIRESQEDRYSCHPNINDQIRGASSSGALSAPASAIAATPSAMMGGGVDGAGAYFGVYDGHGGQAAAVYLEKYLLDNICVHPLFAENLEQAVLESCIQTDKNFLTECDVKRIYCGTTALGAFVIGSKLLVFNIGDCQAVLCSAGEAIELSVPHKPGRSDESERIKRAGGWITKEDELYMYRLHRMDLSDPQVRDKANQLSWVTINRVCGEISVSRSIGDPDYKRFAPGSVVNSAFLWPENHDQIFHADLLIPDPECQVRDLGPDDEFLVLASDGLWDVVSPTEAVTKIRAAFWANKSPSEAAEELCELSIKLGSSDNVTIVIARFIHSTNG